MSHYQQKIFVVRVLHFSAFHSAKQLVGVTLPLGLVVVNLTLLQCSAQVNRFPNTNGLWFQGVWCILFFTHTHTPDDSQGDEQVKLLNIIVYMFITIQVV